MNKNYYILFCFIFLIGCGVGGSSNLNTPPQLSGGSNMLLIGNSFFRPYAQKLDAMAIDAGLVNHNRFLSQYNKKILYSNGFAARLNTKGSKNDLYC